MSEQNASIFDRREIVRIPKPWGYELIWARTDRYVGKVLHVDKGESLSLQYHEMKEETLFVTRGRVRLGVRHGDEQRDVILEPGQAFHVPPHLIHQIEAIEDADIMEVSTTELDDVVRLSDRYGRVKPEGD